MVSETFTNSPPTETDIWNRIVRVSKADLAPAAAQFLIDLDFEDTDHERIADLQTKANEGLLTPIEKQELENYVHVGNVLAILQSKARRSLACLT